MASRNHPLNRSDLWKRADHPALAVFVSSPNECCDRQRLPCSSEVDAAVEAAKLTDHRHLLGWHSKGGQAAGMRVGIIGGSIAGCATAALLHRAGHDVVVSSGLSPTS